MTKAALRVDKWLWFARFCKSRSLAAKLIQDGHVRINRQRTTKASTPVRVGDVITLQYGQTIRVLEVMELGERRGPASEAQLLYAELAGMMQAKPLSYATA